MEAMEAMEAVEGKNEILLGKKRKMKKRREDVKMTLHCLLHPFFAILPFFDYGVFLLILLEFIQPQ